VSEETAAPHNWQPRPDPGLSGAPPLGLRPHRHPPNHLHGWVFVQRKVWVDYWGNEHEIESMPLDYVANVIRFCEERAERIHTIVSFDALCDVLVDLLVDGTDFARHAKRLSLGEEEPLDWLRRTPLLQALERRRNLESEEKHDG
jgi:hypothetical protein